MKTLDLPGVPASIYLEQDENGDRRAVINEPEFTCCFCGAPTDDSEVCGPCTPRACDVLASVAESCLAGLQEAA
jgi:hypothetical protein